MKKNKKGKAWGSWRHVALDRKKSIFVLSKYVFILNLSSLIDSLLNMSRI